MSKHDGSTFDSLLEELGELDEVNARAAKKILAIQAERRMKALGLNATTLATRMGTSRNQIQRLLDADDASVTLAMLFRLAKALEWPITVALGPGVVSTGKSKRRTPAAVKPPVPARAPRRRTAI
jgi:DNA-binding Xre family transcriptional regulator